MEKFPRLFNLEEEKNCMVVDRIKNHGCNWKWRMEVLRGRMDDQRTQLECEIIDIRLNREKDSWIILESPNLEFSVSWFRNMSRALEPAETVWPDVWSSWIPKKKIILAWRAIRGRVPAKTTLVDMGIDIPDVLCPSCPNHVENVDHLFLKCDWATTLWTRISQWWNLPTPEFHTIKEIFEWLDQCTMKEVDKEVMKVIVIANLNRIWDHRNGIIYEKKEYTTDLAFIRIQEESAFWIESRSINTRINRSSSFMSPFKAISMMYSNSGRGHPSYRGGYGRGRGNPPSTSSSSSYRTGSSSNNQSLPIPGSPLYEEFKEFLKTKENIPSFAKSIIDGDTVDDTLEYKELPHKDHIIILENKDVMLYFEKNDDPWFLMSRYLDTSSYAGFSFKNRNYYDNILKVTESVEFSHFTSGGNTNVYNFSKAIKLAEEWGLSTLKEREFMMPPSKPQ
ncbi:hypothetical protein LXL04_020373 [Taraxacum kok-saghyz]